MVNNRRFYGFFLRERKIIEEKLLEEYWEYFTRVKLDWNLLIIVVIGLLIFFLDYFFNIIKLISISKFELSNLK